MVVWTLKCIGYDNNFQQEISQTYPKWVPPLPKTKEEKEAEALEREEKRMLRQRKAEEKQRKRANQLLRQQKRSFSKRQGPVNDGK